MRVMTGDRGSATAALGVSKLSGVLFLHAIWRDLSGGVEYVPPTPARGLGL